MSFFFQEFPVGRWKDLKTSMKREQTQRGILKDITVLMTMVKMMLIKVAEDFVVLIIMT